MAGFLTTHVLDTYHGRPGAGMAVTLLRTADRVELAQVRTNADGRTDEPLLDEEVFATGTYELRFDVGAYFSGAAGVPDPPYLTIVPIVVTMSRDEHYHVPLVCSPWSYTTYRGG